ncbi:MAG TPA: cytochrome c oxidase subunit II [Candidatus Limnocylindrales bacterium]|nr:cytochrome c oxidase subunit II [Candidatus Limnocylindrales bacterium]
MKQLPLFPEQASTIAGRVDALFYFLLIITGFLSLLVVLLIIYFAIKYHRRSEAERPRPVEGSLPLEILWTVFTFGLFMVMFFWGASIYSTLAHPPEDALDIYVIGKQWMWKFQHSGGQREINELHIPVDRPIKLIMSSQDVIHDVFVPAFRVKGDVIPGRYTTLWFQATKPGTYHLFCAEYCGTQHSGMIGRVIVMEPAQYQAWLSGNVIQQAGALTPSPVMTGEAPTSGTPQGSTSPAGVTTGMAPGSAAPLAEAPGTGAAEGSLASAGEKLFRDLGCITCHRLGTQGRGPNLVGIFGKSIALQNGETVVADENYLRESILHPQAKIVAGFQPIMPPYEGRLSEEELIQLIAYIKSLK